MRPPRMRSAGLLAAVVAAALLAAAPVRADTVTDWNVVATDALVTPAGMPQAPPVQTIHLAMVHGAVFDAVNSIDRGYKPYLVRVPARSWYSKDAAAATAAYRVLTNIVPAQRRGARQLAARPAGVHQRPERVGQGRRTVPGQGSRAIPLARPLRPRQPQVRA